MANWTAFLSLSTWKKTVMPANVSIQVQRFNDMVNHYNIFSAVANDSVPQNQPTLGVVDADGHVITRSPSSSSLKMSDDELTNFLHIHKSIMKRGALQTNICTSSTHVNTSHVRTNIERPSRRSVNLYGPAASTKVTCAKAQPFTSQINLTGVMSLASFIKMSTCSTSHNCITPTNAPNLLTEKQGRPTCGENHELDSFSHGNVSSSTPSASSFDLSQQMPHSVRYTTSTGGAASCSKSSIACSTVPVPAVSQTHAYSSTPLVCQPPSAFPETLEIDCSATIQATAVGDTQSLTNGQSNRAGGPSPSSSSSPSEDLTSTARRVFAPACPISHNADLYATFDTRANDGSIVKTFIPFAQSVEQVEHDTKKLRGCRGGQVEVVRNVRLCFQTIMSENESNFVVVQPTEYSGTSVVMLQDDYDNEFDLEN